LSDILYLLPPAAVPGESVTTEPALSIARSLAEAVAYTIAVFVQEVVAGGSSVLAKEATPITHSSASVIVVAYTVAVFIYKVAAGEFTTLANKAAPMAVSPAAAAEIAHAVTVFVHEIVADAVAVFVHEAGRGAWWSVRSRALRQRQTGGCHNQQRDNCAHANACPKSPIPYHVYHLLELICALIIPIQFEEIVKELHGNLESEKQNSTRRDFFQDHLVANIRGDAVYLAK
jgi:hypothetical protein